MELSDAADEMSSKEMDVDSADEMSSKEMDIDSDLSLASPPPEAHDGSDCSSSRDWNDTEPPRGMIRGMSSTAGGRVRGNNWIPIGAAGVSTAAPATEPQTQDHDLRALSALKVRVREAMSVAHWGEPDTAFERQMARLQLHGLDLGTKYRSHHLVQSVKHLAAVAARAGTADALNRNLASVSVASFVRAPGPIWKKHFGAIEQEHMEAKTLSTSQQAPPSFFGKACIRIMPQKATCLLSGNCSTVSV